MEATIKRKNTSGSPVSSSTRIRTDCEVRVDDVLRSPWMMQSNASHQELDETGTRKRKAPSESLAESKRIRIDSNSSFEDELPSTVSYEVPEEDEEMPTRKRKATCESPLNSKRMRIDSESLDDSLDSSVACDPSMVLLVADDSLPSEDEDSVDDRQETEDEDSSSSEDFDTAPIHNNRKSVADRLDDCSVIDEWLIERLRREDLYLSDDSSLVSEDDDVVQVPISSIQQHPETSEDDEESDCEPSFDLLQDDLYLSDDSLASEEDESSSDEESCCSEDESNCSSDDESNSNSSDEE